MTGDERWLDGEAGPVVRPYAVTRGRTRPPGLTVGLIDLVVSSGRHSAEARGLQPEHRRLLGLCSAAPMALADLASEADLPLGVVRVLVGDLQERGLVTVTASTGGSSQDERVLRSVLDGLRAL
ncbi:MAG TPA: DUF742 domain-containing protein [Streptosporangiaceae bacterium]|nr:DUF742 domain-containing protein [Streptosporangiaceae bacterium]